MFTVGKPALTCPAPAPTGPGPLQCPAMTRRRLRTGYRRDGGVDLRRLPNIVQRPLGKEQAYGFAAQLLHGDAGEPPFEGPPTIWLDPSYDGTRRGLEVALHEALHLACPQRCAFWWWTTTP